MSAAKKHKARAKHEAKLARVADRASASRVLEGEVLPEFQTAFVGEWAAELFVPFDELLVEDPGSRAVEGDVTEAEKADASSGTPDAEKETRKRSSGIRSRKRQVVLIASIAIACLLAVAMAAVAFAMNVGRMNMMRSADEVDLNEGAVSYNSGKTVFFEGQEYRLNENMASVLIIGVDKGAEGELNGRADAVMLLAINNDSGKTSLISIPRDSMVEYNRTVDGQYADTVTEQLSLAYRYANSDELSCELMCEAVSRAMYNIPLDYYYALRMEGIVDLADAVGGVQVEALEDVPRAGIYKGHEYLLTGKKAYDYLQYRDIKQNDTALGRQERQKQFIKAFAGKALAEAKGDVSVLLGIYEKLSQYSYTNIGIPEFTYLASHFMAYGIDSFSVDSLQGEMTIGQDGYQEFHLDKDAVYRTVLDVYYTPVEDKQAEEAARAEQHDIDSVSDTRF